MHDVRHMLGIFKCSSTVAITLTSCTSELYPANDKDAAQQTFVLMKTSFIFVFKASWSRPIYSSWQYVFKTSWRRFQDVFKTSSRHLQDVFKTYHQVKQNECLCRSNHPKGSLRKMLWEILHNSQINHLFRNLFFDKVKLCRTATSLKTSL